MAGSESARFSKPYAIFVIIVTSFLRAYGEDNATTVYNATAAGSFPQATGFIKDTHSPSMNYSKRGVASNGSELFSLEESVYEDVALNQNEAFPLEVHAKEGVASNRSKSFSLEKRAQEGVVYNQSEPSLVERACGGVVVNQSVSFPFEERAYEGVALLIICLLAIGGNLTLWIVVIRTPELQTAANSLLLCLSAADLLVSVINMPLTVATIFIGRWVFSEGMCVATGFSNMLTFVGSVMSLCLITLNRYIRVCRPHSYNLMYGRTAVALHISGVWLLSAILSAPPLFGWGEYRYLERQFFCYCCWQSSLSYTIFMVTFCFCGTSSLMTSCYVAIYRKFTRSKRVLSSKTSLANNVTSGAQSSQNLASLEPGTRLSFVSSLVPGNSTQSLSCSPDVSFRPQRLLSVLFSRSRKRSAPREESEDDLHSHTRQNAAEDQILSSCENFTDISITQTSPNIRELSRETENNSLHNGGPSSKSAGLQISQESSSHSLDFVKGERGNVSDEDIDSDVTDITKAGQKQSPTRKSATVKLAENNCRAEPTANRPLLGSVIDNTDATDDEKPNGLKTETNGLGFSPAKMSFLRVASLAHVATSTSISSTSARAERRRREEIRLTSTMLLVILVYVISWLPYSSTILLNNFLSEPIPRQVDMLTLLMGYANSLYNPFIYGWRNSNIRRGYVQLYRDICDNLCRSRRNARSPNVVFEL